MKCISIILLSLMIMSCAERPTEPVLHNLYSNLPPYNLNNEGVEEIWDKGIDGVTRVSKVQIPQLYVYQAKDTGEPKPAVVVCPGGGYSILAIDLEGFEIAEAFNKQGITAIVLKYRLPDSTLQTSPGLVPSADAREAIKWVRENAEELNVLPDRIGIMGFSAGGHLASSISVQKSAGEKARPDFSILVYPVITFVGEYAHLGSRHNLIGKVASDSLASLYSSHLQVDADTPPAFLVHAQDDKSVPMQNSIMYHEALKEQKTTTEMHILEQGGHGFGLGEGIAQTEDWFELCARWVKGRK